MNWWSYLSVCLIASFSPGPAVVLALNTTLNAGPRYALLSSAGNAAGIVCLASLCLGSVNYLLVAYPELLVGLKYAGAAYLIYLSGRMLRPLAIQSQTTSTVAYQGNTRIFFQGYWVALTNPKSLLFFCALFPQFLSAGASNYLQLAMLLVFALCAMLSHVCYIAAANYLWQGLAGTRMQLLIRVIPAILLFGLALSFVV